MVGVFVVKKLPLNAVIFSKLTVWSSLLLVVKQNTNNQPL